MAGMQNMPVPNKTTKNSTICHGSHMLVPVASQQQTHVCQARKNFISNAPAKVAHYRHGDAKRAMVRLLGCPATVPIRP